jgi:PKD repeat protein
MKSLKLSVILLAILLAGIIIIPIVNAAPDDNFVSIEKATSVAGLYVKQVVSSASQYTDWKNATVRKETTYYDLDGNESAYSFDVLVNGSYAGYLMVSATRDNYPVLEFSKGQTPDGDTTYQTNARELATSDADARQAALGEGRPIYLGATFFYMEYPVENAGTEKNAAQKGNDRIYVDLQERRVVDLKKGSGAAAQVTTPLANESVAPDEKTIEKMQQQKVRDAQAEWSSAEKKLAPSAFPEKESVMDGTSTSEEFLWGVPIHKQIVGCTPSAAAMVLGYYKDNYQNTRFPVFTTLTPELGTAMGTTSDPNNNGGTVWTNIDAGINTICNKYQYICNPNTTPYGTDYNDAKAEISAKRPFILWMQHGGAAEGETEAYGEHTVTVRGYYEALPVVGPDYYYINDNWNPKNFKMIRYGNWVFSHSTWVRPNYTPCTLTPPVAAFDIAPESGSVGDTITFIDRSWNSPTAWFWDFGCPEEKDTGLITEPSRDATHRYLSASTFKVTLIASNCAGATQQNHTILINNPSGGTANDKGEPTTTTEGGTVQFTDLSTPTPQEWNWSFGDGGGQFNTKS